MLRNAKLLSALDEEALESRHHNLHAGCTLMAVSMLVADLLAHADPAELARRAGIDPDDWQQRFLRSTSDRILLNCSRQSGKSTMAAVRACHTALYEAGSLTLLVSPSERQSGELASKVRAVMSALEWPLPAEQSTALQLRLSNGSRIVALPGQEGTIRGYRESVF